MKAEPDCYDIHFIPYQTNIYSSPDLDKNKPWKELHEAIKTGNLIFSKIVCYFIYKEFENHLKRHFSEGKIFLGEESFWFQSDVPISLTSQQHVCQ